ncbi:hypothetical protein [Caballeronia sp. DA-9]|uniref:hypothetical protein n=1 Tax=Caballeronia sp. DA-9 TaxID=3436237 RepID=UPI003F668F81
MTDGHLISLILTFIVAGGGAYFGSYLREKGKSLATKEDIGNITTIVEQVKVEIARQDWAQREWTQLRRIKLEELLTAAQGRSRYVFAVETAAAACKLTEEDPTVQLETLAALYFPELEKTIRQFVSVGNEKLTNALRMTLESERAKGAPTLLRQHRTAFNMRVVSMSGPMLEAERALRTEARSLLLRIMPSANGLSTE